MSLLISEVTFIRQHSPYIIFTHIVYCYLWQPFFLFQPILLFVLPGCCHYQVNFSYHYVNKWILNLKSCFYVVYFKLFIWVIHIKSTVCKQIILHWYLHKIGVTQYNLSCRLGIFPSPTGGVTKHSSPSPGLGLLDPRAPFSPPAPSCSFVLLVSSPVSFLFPFLFLCLSGSGVGVMEYSALALSHCCATLA